MTHADMIRGMSDEDLLKFLTSIHCSYIAKINNEIPLLPTSPTAWADWLKEEIK